MLLLALLAGATERVLHFGTLSRAGELEPTLHTPKGDEGELRTLPVGPVSLLF